MASLHYIGRNHNSSVDSSSTFSPPSRCSPFLPFMLTVPNLAPLPPMLWLWAHHCVLSPLLVSAE